MSETQTEIGGVPHYRDAKGRLVPASMVSAADRLIDQTVRKIIGHAGDLSGKVGRFKGHTFDDIYTLLDLLSEQYGVSKGGRKGNLTLMTFDGCLKVQLQVSDLMTFGPELQIAKTLIDECISGWSEGSNDETKALVHHAFQTDKEGKINRAALFQLRRVPIQNERWKVAMQAVSDAIRIIGSKEYLRFYRREHSSAAWQSITVDLAAA